MTKDTPSTEQVKDAWVTTRLDYKTLSTKPGRVSAEEKRFDRWLSSVKAEAWAECQAAMDERQLLVDVSGRYRDPVVNPYLENAK